MTDLISRKDLLNKIKSNFCVEPTDDDWLNFSVIKEQISSAPAIEQGEPVAWMQPETKECGEGNIDFKDTGCIPLYATPAQSLKELI